MRQRWTLHEEAEGSLLKAHAVNEATTWTLECDRFDATPVFKTKTAVPRPDEILTNISLLLYAVEGLFNISHRRRPIAAPPVTLRDPCKCLSADSNTRRPACTRSTPPDRRGTRLGCLAYARWLTPRACHTKEARDSALAVQQHARTGNHLFLMCNCINSVYK